MRFSDRSRWASAFVCALFALPGCGDAGGGGSGSGAGAGAVAGPIGGTMPDVSACEGQFEGEAPACQECVLASECLEELVACCKADGCAAIVQCARSTGCEEIDCYTQKGKAGPCAAVIDMHGGPLGKATAAALEVGDCVEPVCPMCTM